MRKPKSYAEFIQRERGVPEHPDNTVEMQSTFNPAFLEVFKEQIPHARGRNWDPEGQRWFINPRFLDMAAVLAMRFFPAVYQTKGVKTICLNTGDSFTQPALF